MRLISDEAALTLDVGNLPCINPATLDTVNPVKCYEEQD
jgi:hypothetical protein